MADTPDTPKAPESPGRDSTDPTQDQPCGSIALESRIEAVLISTDKPLAETKLADLLGLSGKGTKKTITDAIATLNTTYEKSKRAFRIERLAGGWQVLTQPEFGPLLTRLHTVRQSAKLSQPALETLSIIAYRQPIMRAEIEAIRGVACGEVLRGLLERRLVKIVGRAEELGRPMLYGTTKEFLEVFGLSSADDLPVVDGLKPGRPPEPKKPEPVDDVESADDKPAASSGDAQVIESKPDPQEGADIAPFAVV